MMFTWKSCWCALNQQSMLFEENTINGVNNEARREYRGNYQSVDII